MGADGRPAPTADGARYANPDAAVFDPKRLSALAATGLLDTTPEEAFDRVTRIATRLLGVPVSLVSLVDEDRQFFKSQAGLPEPWASARETPLSHSFCQHVVNTADVLSVSDARSDARVCDNLAIRDLSVIAYLGVPLVLPDGAVIGSLCAIDTQPRAWGEAEEATLRDLASIVMDEIALRDEVVRRAEAERQQELLIRELQHRMKNTLAMVQSMIGLSLRNALDMDHFRDSITLRIAALGHTHDLLVEGRWGSASLRDLLSTELAAQSDQSRVRLLGPDVQLSAQFAIGIGMAIHELMTNAAKHGALSTPGGVVTVDWGVSRGDEADILSLTWVESGGPPVSPPTRSGFGSFMIEKVLTQQMQASYDVAYDPSGLRARLVIPLPDGMRGREAA